MTSARKLRLGPLPRNENVKLTFSCPVGLKNELDRYAVLHEHTYGEEVDAVALIPHMLAAFISRDRTFNRMRRTDGSAVERVPAAGPLVAVRTDRPDDPSPVDGQERKVDLQPTFVGIQVAGLRGPPSGGTAPDG